MNDITMIWSTDNIMTSLKIGIGIGYEWWKKNRLSVKPIFALSVNHYSTQYIDVIDWYMSYMKLHIYVW